MRTREERKRNTWQQEKRKREKEIIENKNMEKEKYKKINEKRKMSRREEGIYRSIENFKKSCKEGKKSGRNKDPWKKENETKGKI